VEQDVSNHLYIPAAVVARVLEQNNEARQISKAGHGQVRCHHMKPYRISFRHER
jgi:hypothetical protein